MLLIRIVAFVALSIGGECAVVGGSQGAKYLQPEGLYTEFPVEGADPPKPTRNSRLLLSLAATPLLDALRRSPSPAYAPVGNDFFDFLRDDYPLPYSVQSEYDFVVIGAGSAGSVVASRLSEGGRWTVLLLEAGGPEGLITEVPLLAAYAQGTHYNWGYSMEKLDGLCLGMKDQRCGWPRGKVIGGSSVINYMIYTRGHRRDYDRIAAAGNPGWSYDEVLPYFLKSEMANLNGLENSPHHNRSGLMSVEHIRYKTRLMDTFLDGAVELGEKIVDYNQGDRYGFSRVQAQTLHGRRHSAAKAFLYPFRHRQNLHILPHSRVTKININKKTSTAKSVEYVRNRLKFKVKARKEIVLSAGALNSPQILMLSGIGPKEHLEELGIPVLKNLPVGQNMYDHLSYVGLQFLVNDTESGAVIETAVLSVENTLNWLKRGEGPFTLIGCVEGLGYIKTNVSEEEGDYPDMEFLFIPGGITADKSGAVRKGMKISDEFFHEVYGDIVEKPSWTVLPMILHPKSKGYMKLKDNNPFHWPKFYYDYFSDERDLKTLIEAIKYSIRLSETKAFQKYGSTLYKKHFPTCKEHEFGSDAYWGCALRTLATTLHHQVGTCKMGPASDPEAIVDHELRVHGVRRLRVADTSIIPVPLTAHTNAPAVMVGEKLADMLKATWA